MKNQQVAAADSIVASFCFSFDKGPTRIMEDATLALVLHYRAGHAPEVAFGDPAVDMFVACFPDLDDTSLVAAVDRVLCRAMEKMGPPTAQWTSNIEDLFSSAF